MTKISVIMAAYNAAAFIRHAIASIQAQTHENWELLVIDDCSTDKTAALVENLSKKDTRIKLLRAPRNSGPAAARNIGLSAAEGHWITVLDSDDFFVPARLELLLRYAQEGGYDMLADNQFFYDEAEKQIVNQGFFDDADIVPLTLLRLVKNDGPPLWFSFGLLKPFLRTAFVRRHKLHYAEHLRIGEDFRLLFFALAYGARAALLSQPLYVYTMPFGSSSRLFSTRSRTDHSQDGWQALLDANEDLRARSAALFPNDHELDRAFAVREKRVRDEITWRASRLANGDSKLLRLSAIFRVSLTPYLSGKIRNKLCKKHRII